MADRKMSLISQCKCITLDQHEICTLQKSANFGKKKIHMTTHRKQLWFQLHNAVWPLLLTRKRQIFNMLID